MSLPARGWRGKSGRGNRSAACFFAAFCWVLDLSSVQAAWRDPRSLQTNIWKDGGNCHQFVLVSYQQRMEQIMRSIKLYLL